MPMYQYRCPKCSLCVEHNIPIAERDTRKIVCGYCCSQLERDKVYAVATAGPRFEMQAVLGNGDHVKGHFGKEARLDPLKRAKRLVGK